MAIGTDSRQSYTADWIVATMEVVRTQREERVEIGGAILWCATTGQGPAVVLAHGGPGMSDNLGPVADLIGDIATVHRFDQRACGRSTGEGVGQNIASAIEDLDALRRYFGHEKWIVGGHSWGAALAMFYALAHPLRTKAVIYLSGPGIAHLTTKPAAKSRRERLTAFERAEFESLEARAKLGDADAQRRLTHLYWRTDFSDANKAPDFNLSPMFAYPRNEDAANALRNSAQERFSQGNLVAEVRGLDVPVLVLHGTDDPLPVEGAIALAGLLPNAKLVTVEAVGHLPWLEDAESTKKGLRDFLTEVTATDL